MKEFLPLSEANQHTDSNFKIILERNIFTSRAEEARSLIFNLGQPNANVPGHRKVHASSSSPGKFVF
jgi:hypothetical protein